MVSTCRFCAQPLSLPFVDLGVMPLSNDFRPIGDPPGSAPSYPLKPMICEACLLIQLPVYEAPERIFDDYAYFSSFSETWVDHARRYCDAVTRRFDLGPSSRVLEVASNDGYLLRHFVDRGIPCFGIEPSHNVAAAAVARGVPTEVAFFTKAMADGLAADGRRVDLLVANNVLAHVPDLNDFVSAIAQALKPSGVATLEFPYVANLIDGVQFDTIYHEHFSYFSFHTVTRVFAGHGLRIFDVERLATHGGSIRIFAAPDGDAPAPDERVAALHAYEADRALNTLDAYRGFQTRVSAAREGLRAALTAARERGETVGAYGAPAKGTVLLNYCAIGPDLLAFTVDKNPKKQGCRVPGVEIPIFAPEHIRTARPDAVMILPWNLKDEIVNDLSDYRAAGGRCFVPLPEVEAVG